MVDLMDGSPLKIVIGYDIAENCNHIIIADCFDRNSPINTVKWEKVEMKVYECE